MKIISVNNADGMITYEFDHARGTLREQLSVVDYPTKEAILARIAERETEVGKEIGEDSKSVIPEIPAEITAMAELVYNG